MTPEQEAEYWKAVAVFLADIHAANMEIEGPMSRTSQRTKERLKRICCVALELLKGAKPTNFQAIDYGDVCERLRKAKEL